MILYIISIAYFFLIVEIVLIVKSFSYARRERNTKRPSHCPKAAIIAPHYGWNAQIGESLRPLLNQDYAGEYVVYFVTHAVGESNKDLSYPHLLEIAEEHPGNVRVLLAPNVVDNGHSRSQKVQNLITAIAELPDDVDIIAFVDADVVVQEDWLTLLVQPLQDPRIGATVGARFYQPQSFNLATLSEAIWVNFQIALQGNHPLAMVWGGSNAIRRELLDRGKVLDRWENSAIEDHNLTHAVRDLNLKVHFVPNCIAITQTTNRTWKQVFEFTNRQMIMTFRMGFRIEWGLSLIAFLPKSLIVFASILFMPFYFYHLCPLLLVPIIEIQSYRFFSLNLPHWLRIAPKMRQTIRITSFATPISVLVVGLNALYAIFQKKIVWGGVGYEILSATTCRVLGRVAVRNNDDEKDLN